MVVQSRVWGTFLIACTIKTHRHRDLLPQPVPTMSCRHKLNELLVARTSRYREKGSWLFARALTTEIQ